MSLLQLVLVFMAVPFVMAFVAALPKRRAPVQGDAPAMPDMDAARGLASRLDLPALLQAVAARLAPEAEAQGTRISLAVSPGRTVHANGAVLSAVLRETIEIALRASAAGQVLVSVLPLGSQMHILVTDSGPRSDQGMRESLARPAGAALALQGGTVAVEVRPGHGTTVTLRLPLLPPPIHAERGESPTSAERGEIPTSAERGEIPTSAERGEIQTSAERGETGARTEARAPAT